MVPFGAVGCGRVPYRVQKMHTWLSTEQFDSAHASSKDRFTLDNRTLGLGMVRFGVAGFGNATYGNKHSLVTLRSGSIPAVLLGEMRPLNSIIRHGKARLGQAR